MLELIEKKWRRWLGVAAIYFAITGVVSFFSSYYGRLMQWSLWNDEATIPTWIAIGVPLVPVMVIGIVCSFIRAFVSFYCLHMEMGHLTPQNEDTLRRPIYRWLARIAKKLPDAGIVLAAATPCPVYFMVFLLNASKSKMRMGYAITLIQFGNIGRVVTYALVANYIGPERLQRFWHHIITILTNLLRYLTSGV